ncbi:glycogen debranching protein [Persicobacter diffluens]
MRKLLMAIPLAVMAGCSEPTTEQKIYESEAFTVYSDKVVQGKYTAEVVGQHHMTSDYLSPENENYLRTIPFKFSINLKDNELPYNVNHQLVVRPNAEGFFESPVVTFGKLYVDKEAGVQEVLEPDSEVRFRLDMRPVLEAFEKKGYYTDVHGDKIYKEDFKGVFIAGSSFPLSYDFENLGNFGHQLTDEDGDGIFEITLKMNYRHPDRYVKTDWELSKDISAYPQLETEMPLLKALYDMALEETVLLSEADGTFRTGAKWEGVWTRDVSYAIALGMGMADVERAKTSLLKKVKRDRIIQDTGSGGAWPVSSDRTTWSLAAWEIYAVTGDPEWLNFAYKVIKNSVEDDREVILDHATGLMRGESSFLDWRVQTYPRWMDNVDIYRSMNLGTNAVHYRTYQILADMAGILGKSEDQKAFIQYGEDLKKAINEYLWLPEQKYYGQYLYGRRYMVTSPKSETLGEAFTVLFGIADGQRAADVIANTPMVAYGAPCVYPQIPNMTPYHNDGIWPFVQGFWNLAAAKSGNGEAVAQGLAGMYRAAALFLTNKENMVADNGDFITSLNSDRQLWSVAGNLGMVYKLLFGMQVSPEGNVDFNPVIPKDFENKMKLTGFKLRGKIFDISIEGYGNQIKSFKVDGKRSNVHSVALAGEGKHQVEIVMANNDLGKGLTVLPNKYHLPMPEAKVEGDQFKWNTVEGALKYEVFVDGKSAGMVESTYVPAEALKEYAVRAVDSEGDVSFLSQPVLADAQKVQTVAIKPYVKDKNQKISKAIPEMVDLTKERNTHISWTVNEKAAGKYFVWFDYTNGAGPWNTDNKCATRTLKVNGKSVGPIVMAQRGANEWASVGQTNIIEVTLKKGKNTFSLDFEAFNENMNVDENTALLGKLYIQAME